jgi:hypothetical protein
MGMNDVQLPSAALAPGRLNRMFRSGRKAVVLDSEEEIGRVLESALQWLNHDTAFAHGSVVPQFSGLASLAGNHIPGDLAAGDMFRFIPGGIGHMARRFIVYQELQGDSPVCFPEKFWNNGRLAPPPSGLVDDIWALMNRILGSSLPRPVVPGTFGIEVALLVYPARISDTENLHALFADSAGGWTRLGGSLDRRGGVVGWVGFEPTANGLKGRCSTTELPTRMGREVGDSMGKLGSTSRNRSGAKLANGREGRASPFKTLDGRARSLDSDSGSVAGYPSVRASLWDRSMTKFAGNGRRCLGSARASVVR